MTIAVLRVVERCWKEAGLNLEMLPYGCCSTGDCRGMIEAVPNSITLARMIAEHAGGSKIKKAITAFSDKSVSKLNICSLNLFGNPCVP